MGGRWRVVVVVMMDERQRRRMDGRERVVRLQSA